MTGKYFPAPGQDAGYREAGQPAPDLAPRAPEPLEVHAHVIATRPDDPELALQRASTEAIARKQELEIARREEQLRRERVRGIVLGIVYVVVIFAVAFLFARSMHNHPKISPGTTKPATTSIP